jgi:hypothetical protein
MFSHPRFRWSGIRGHAKYDALQFLLICVLKVIISFASLCVSSVYTQSGKCQIPSLTTTEYLCSGYTNPSLQHTGQFCGPLSFRCRDSSHLVIPLFGSVRRKGTSVNPVLPYVLLYLRTDSLMLKTA